MRDIEIIAHKLINIKGREKQKRKEKREFEIESEIRKWKKKKRIEGKQRKEMRIYECRFFLFLKNIRHASCFNVFLT